MGNSIRHESNSPRGIHLRNVCHRKLSELAKSELFELAIICSLVRASQLCLALVGLPITRLNHHRFKKYQPKSKTYFLDRATQRGFKWFEARHERAVLGSSAKPKCTQSCLVLHTIMSLRVRRHNWQKQRHHPQRKRSTKSKIVADISHN